MKLSISETAKLSGVSVRTLHYYDQIGLLKPSEITESGYRYYNDESLELLQQILFYRELDFSLKEIQKFLFHPNYDKTEALKKQKELLLLKEKRLKTLIHLIDNRLKGENDMSFTEFNMKEIDEAKASYAKEAKERWGSTDAYKESIQKTDSYTPEEWAKIKAESNDIMSGFAKLLGSAPDSEEAQVLVKRWQKHISKHYYHCTKEILAGLGLMYVSDEKFLKNIDTFGVGTAQFMSDAIAVYCR